MNVQQEMIDALDWCDDCPVMFCGQRCACEMKAIQDSLEIMWEVERREWMEDEE